MSSDVGAVSELAASDEAAIRQLLARYCRGIDRLDVELLKTVYWPDSIDHHGVFDGSGPSFAEWIVPFMRQKYTASLHVLGQSLLLGHGDVVLAETYFSSFHGLLHDGQRSTESIGGRYADRLQRRGREWRILERHLIIDFASETPNPPGQVEQGGTFALGRRDRSDVSYSVLA